MHCRASSKLVEDLSTGVIQGCMLYGWHSKSAPWQTESVKCDWQKESHLWHLISRLYSLLHTLIPVFVSICLSSPAILTSTHCFCRANKNLTGLYVSVLVWEQESCITLFLYPQCGFLKQGYPATYFNILSHETWTLTLALSARSSWQEG